MSAQDTCAPGKRGGSNTKSIERSSIYLLLIVTVSILVSSCAYVFKQSEPIPCVYHRLPVAARPDTLIVLLPGIFSGPSYFVHKGIIATLQASVCADIVAVDAHSGYYQDQTLVSRLWLDIISPARKQGYDQVWLIGFSLGGLGALIFAREMPEVIDGIIALSPYLGDNNLRREIQQAGGLAAWQPDLSVASDRYRQVLLWLQQQGHGTQPGPALYLGYGLDDRMAPLLGLVSQVLPSDHVVTLPGGHYWRTWRKIVQRFLEQGVLSQRIQKARSQYPVFQRSSILTTGPIILSPFFRKQNGD
ncbi:alpha/beta hydrolase [bacterium]|nr:alpha/beta hydrolase [bacterium]